jgi:initiation factor 1A
LEQDSNGEDLFLYAQVDAVLGGKHVSLKSLTDETLIGSIRGNMYKKVWLNKGDFVLCSKRIGLNDNKCDIIFKYNSDEVQFLKKSKEILIQEQETNNFIENQIFTQQENAEEIEEDEKIDNLSDIDIDEI